MNLRRDLEASIDSSLGLDKQSVLLSHPQLSEFNNVVDFVSPSRYCCAFLSRNPRVIHQSGSGRNCVGKFLSPPLSVAAAVQTTPIVPTNLLQCFFPYVAINEEIATIHAKPRHSSPFPCPESDSAHSTLSLPQYPALMGPGKSANLPVHLLHLQLAILHMYVAIASVPLFGCSAASLAFL